MISENKKIAISICALSLVAVLILEVLLQAFFPLQAPKDSVINTIKIDPSLLTTSSDKNTTMSELEQVIMNLPNGSLKACMLTCIAATYSGDIDSLKEIIMEYNRLKLLELKRKNQI